MPKITLKVTGKDEDTWPLANKVAMRVKSTCLQLQRDGTVNQTVTEGVNKENILWQYSLFGVGDSGIGNE